MSSPWEQAQQQVSNSSATPSQVAEDFTGEESQLFGGEYLPPSLLTKEHGQDDKRTGIITEAPFDVHSRDFTTKEPKYWTADNKVTKDATDRNTGQPNRPVKDTVIKLDTEYRFTAQQLQEKDLTTDDGERAFYAGGEALKALRIAIKKAGIKSGADMVGKRLTVWRSGQRPSKVGGNPAWLLTVEISNA